MSNPDTSAIHLFDLASEELGGAVLWANDDFFAEKDNLLRKAAPYFDAERFTDRGKWMDGWETRRRRTPGHDTAIIRLGVPGTIERIIVDTSFFRGNYPDTCSVEGCSLPHDASVEELQAHEHWLEIIPQSKLQGHHHNTFEIAARQRFTHLRLHIYPDGGVARLRVLGSPLPDPARMRGVVDVAAALSGAATLSQSDMFFGLAQNLLKPTRGIHMGDGWETTRRRGPGHDWVLIRLAAEATIEEVEIDTNHFKGNYPDSATLELYDAEPANPAEEQKMTAVILKHKTQAHTQHVLQLQGAKASTHVILRIYPDGGVSRLRLRGRLTDRGHLDLSLRALNAMHDHEAHAVFLACCGSEAWASAMVARLPYASEAALNEAADAAWADVTDDDRLQAFRAHPRIGGAANSAWSKGEQASAHTADETQAADLARLNDQYFDKHGFIFIICATGKTAHQVRDALITRLDNSTADEIANAAEEQRRITRLRLNKWLRGV